MIFFVGRRWLGPAWRSHSCGAAFGWLLVLSSHTCACTQTHARTHTHIYSQRPLWPRPFPALGWSIGWCLPCDCRGKRGGEKVALVACPGESISVSYPWAVPDPWPTLLSIGSWSSWFFLFLFFRWVWKCGRHIDFYPVANKGLGLQKSVKSPELNVLARRGSNDVSEKHWNNRKYLVWLLLISHLVSFLYFYMTFL